MTGVVFEPSSTTRLEVALVDVDGVRCVHSFPCHVRTCGALTATLAQPRLSCQILRASSAAMPM